MGLLKTTFANGVEWVYDPEKAAHATHYGDADGVRHDVVSTVPAPEGAEEGFTEPGGAAPEDTAPEAADAEPDVTQDTAVSEKDAAYQRRIDELERQVKAGKHAEPAAGDYVPSG